MPDVKSTAAADDANIAPASDEPMMHSRRTLIQAAGGVLLASSIAKFEKAHGMTKPGSEAMSAPSYAYLKEHEGQDVTVYPNVHHGVGEIAIKYFRGEGTLPPDLMLIYDILPGGSEGVHTHNIGDEEMGSYDEFYYILSGEGVMEIDGERVPVKPGDHVVTPNGVAHGIANTSPDTNLKVYLTCLERTGATT